MINNEIYGDNEIYGQFTRIEWLLRRRQSQGRGLHGSASDPHRGQGRVLAFLKLKMEISQKELSTILGIRSQSLGELLMKLESKGYITRTQSTTDRRAINIRLTETGKTAAEQVEPEGAGLFDCLNNEEKNSLHSYLERIIESLENETADKGSHWHKRRPEGVSIDIDIPQFLSGKKPFIHIKHHERNTKEDD